MRSILIPHYVKKNHEDDCPRCVELGYLTYAQQSDNEFKEIVSSTQYTLTENLLFHLLVTKKNIQSLKNIHYVGCDECFRKYTTSKEKIAVIFSDVEKMENTFSCYPYIYPYLYIDHNFIIKNQWKKPCIDIKIFSKEVDAIKVLTFFNSILTKKTYETPFGHDQTDKRNPEHLKWIFKPEINPLNSLNSNKKPSMSVIIPFFNRKSLLEKTLASLTRQKIEFEIILLDDGSNDDCKKMIENFIEQNPMIQIVYHYIKREDKLTSLFVGNRVGPIRNLGAHLARAEILLFLDSDILLPENYLEKIYHHHKTLDVTLSKRVYLNEKTSLETEGLDLSFHASQLIKTPWDEFMNKVYLDEPWPQVDMPWKYFMTYALSIRKNLFKCSGGFRTNFIAYGYEDIDLGYRVLKMTNRYRIIDIEVYHQYHFYKKNEYDLKSFKRYFQLSISAYQFTLQNMPTGKHDLELMIRPKNLSQKILILPYRFMWKMNILKKALRRYRKQSYNPTGFVSRD